MLRCVPSAGLVEADALHAPLSDSAPATPNAATAPFRPPLLFEIRLSPDIGFLQLSFNAFASMALASL